MCACVQDMTRCDRSGKHLRLDNLWVFRPFLDEVDLTVFLEAGGQSIVFSSKIPTMVPVALFLLLTGALAKPPPMDDGPDMDGIIFQ